MTTVALSLLINSLLGHATFLLLFAVLAVVGARHLGRMRFGLLLATLAALLVNDFLLPPLIALDLTSPIALTRLLVSGLEGLLISSLFSAMQEARVQSSSWEPGPRSQPMGSPEEGDRSRLLLESSWRSRRRFRLSIEEIKDYAIVLLDSGGVVISWNAGAERILGYRAKQAVRMHSSRFYGDRDRDRGRPKSDLDLAATQGHHEVEGWRFREDGSRLWAKVGMTALRDEKGGLRGFATVTRDITDLKKAEEALRLVHEELERRVLDRTAELARANQALQAEVAERRRAEEALGKQSAVLHSILDNMVEAVLMAEMGGRVLPCNPAAERMFGLGRDGATAAEWRDSGLVTIATGEGPSARDLPLICSIRGEDVNDAEVFVRRPGEVEGRWALVNGRALRDGAGTPTGAVVVYRDITERRRAAEELRVAKEAAEAASRARDRFLAALSHELRTPLTPVLLAVSAMVSRPPAAEALPEILAMIGRNVELEARLIDDLLDLTRATSGRISLRLERVDAHSVVRRSLELCQAEITEARLSLSLDLSAPDSHVEGDLLRLQQVFWNLIKNAVKFTPAGGSIAIRSRNRPTPDLPGPGPAVGLVIEVSDTGIGIAPEALSKIFDPFEQGGPSIQRRYGGLGLGLAISRELAAAHGGSLTVACDGEGLGSTFVLRLPSVEAPAPPASTPRGATEGPKALDILLVEDNLDTNRAIAMLLQGRGHRVTTAFCVAEARAAAAAGQFDMLLSDIGLPDGSGLDLMRELRAKPDREVIAGIAMSGFGSADDVQLSLEAGFAAHLTKPVTFRLLESTLLECAGPSGPGGPARAACLA